MRIAIATGQPLDALMDADSQQIATWIDILNDHAERR